MSTLQRIISPYEIITEFTEIELENMTGNYIEIARSNVFCLFFGVNISTNSKDVFIKCEIDGVVSFEIDLINLKTMYSVDNMCPVSYNDSEHVFMFKPFSPLLIKNNIKFFAKASTTSTSKKIISSILECASE